MAEFDETIEAGAEPEIPAEAVAVEEAPLEEVPVEEAGADPAHANMNW